MRAARGFASRELGLPDNGSYRSYADLKRPYVVWNVVAVPEFSVHPQRWCFPIAGCVAYRGYFAEAKARKFAASMDEQGFDTFVGGVPAYSTLGKFRDPVLNTMLGYGDDELAAIIFHELSHQLVYVPGDSEFNEAFATAVEQAGLERWLTACRAAKRISGATRRDARGRHRSSRLFTRARSKLADLYKTRLAPEAMRERKRAMFEQLDKQICRPREATGHSLQLSRSRTQRPEQCSPRVARDVLRLRAGIRAAAEDERRQPAGVLFSSEGAWRRSHAPSGTSCSVGVRRERSVRATKATRRVADVTRPAAEPG